MPSKSRHNNAICWRHLKVPITSLSLSPTPIPSLNTHFNFQLRSHAVSDFTWFNKGGDFRNTFGPRINTANISHKQFASNFGHESRILFDKTIKIMASKKTKFVWIEIKIVLLKLFANMILTYSFTPCLKTCSLRRKILLITIS